MSTTEVVVPVFPQDQDAFYHSDDNGSPLPDQPKHIGPISDPDKCREPLSAFDILSHANAFGVRSHWDSEACVPARPDTFSDRYLYPTLTQNEHTRLTMFWYYTRGLNEDTVLLKKLNQMLDLTKQSLGWEVGIIGMVDAQTFTRIVAANMSLATIPRRESTCSHTVNQPPGTVFQIVDMSQDWRFKHSPAVEGEGGLRSYAGTPIRLRLHNGEVVVFGSVCIASDTVQRPLTDDQKKVLVRAADMMAGELVTRTRLRRMRERQAMTDVLTQLRSDDNILDIEETTVQAMLQRYPGCRVGITKIHDNSVAVEGRAPIPLSTFTAGLWEDTERINSVTQSGFSETPVCECVVRAIVGQIKPRDRALVVASTDMRLVWDDLDSWFVDQCAQIINSASQARALKDALAAKEKFLRTVTHELRTPIHGILSSVELLSDEMKARQTLQTDVMASNGLRESDKSLASFLHTIRRSGTELMTTVNNLLRMNTLTNDNMNLYPTDYGLRSIESDVLGEIFANFSEDHFQGLSICFENQVPESNATVRVDADLLKELLKCLVANAIAATDNGSIQIISSVLPDHEALRFDIIDTGTGINNADQQRIFLAFEKLDVHSRGSGLGLNLASQMASMLKGTLSLVFSQPGIGSHFRLELPYVQTVSRSTTVTRQRTRSRPHLPPTYYVALRSKHNLHLLSHLEKHLTRCGMVKSNVAQNALIIMNRPEPFQDMLDEELRSINGPHMILFVSDMMLDYTKQCLRDEVKPHLGFPISGPLFTTRLDELLAEADDEFAKYCKQFTPSPFSQDSQLAKSLSNLQITSQNADTVCPSEELCDEPVELEVPITPLLPPRTLRVQVVDDNTINLNVLQFFCKRRKIPYGTATDGNKSYSNFVSAAPTEPYTLVLMDLQMPECDGVEACKRIRAYEKGNNLQPAVIFMITGQDSVADRKNSFEAGVDDFFVKPVSLKKLDQAIAQYFSQSPG
ncbi:hypothetical protein OHC33_003201 [Knufia fluminis]|uniref:histidine kinase n=1 Tax=Knufia fluminis TaxID=191047 RepID=A0AAN8ETP0_9EURO|nr:hypothetical protein OHC33_003201 [Knufia fluminis]